MSPLFWLIYPLTGALAGLLAGLFGLGGGLVMVPALLWIFDLQGFAPAHLMHLAVGTSLAAIVFTGTASAQAHLRRGAVDMRLAGWLTLGILLGAALGSVLAGRLEGETLRALFGGFLILVATKLALELQPGTAVTAPRPLLLLPAGGGIGALSVLLGIGGGTLTVPLLLWLGAAMTTAVGTAAACGVPIALAGTLGFVLIGRDAAGLPPASLGYVYWPAVLGLVLLSIPGARLGAVLAHRLPARRLRRLFALVLILVGVHMLS
ncbi:putative permease [Thiohalobacter thiocyanaticus]|uniref:Probable membrane transporter protein n=1 Tax=Thiohalobacter thiocyanaticus TaxID=585455 RepID=A0A1Z4VN55_9GAMM|nr:sulfite exporter TauE/SafE family protein [Thiohalobacter thiocyanaticus]BAZ92862.1 putative permease [Thiohalobacter thiocyanaticus]